MNTDRSRDGINWAQLTPADEKKLMRESPRNNPASD